MTKLFIVATETSGDFLGAELMKELTRGGLDYQASGVGGDGMVAQGLDTIYRIDDFNVMGLFEVVSQLRRLKRQFNRLIEHVTQVCPDVIVLIDAPDFNIRFARAVRALEIPIIYYVGPQVWAWRRKRAAQLAELVDHIMLLFQFEADFYRDLPAKATVVGHPLVDELGGYRRSDQARVELGFELNRPLVVLAPGSRRREVSSLLPVMKEVIIQRPQYQYGLAMAPTISREMSQSLLGEAYDRVRLGPMRELMSQADAAVVASGTATLETGLLGVPMVVGYRMSSMTYVLARRLVKIPHVALVNIVLNDRVVPELIQGDFTATRVIHEVDDMIRNAERRQEITDKLTRIPGILGGGGASQRAAEVVAGYVT